MTQISFLPMPWRERFARAIYETRPFYMGTTTGVLDGMGIATRFSWDGAPASYQDECYALADAIIAEIHLGREAGNCPPLPIEMEQAA